MALTWRDVAAPDFRAASAISQGANEAIQSGVKGLASTFDRFGQQFVDKDTNAAIKAAMGLGNVNTVDADAARILASSGQDVDLAKYNAAVLQKADALRGTERFNREGQTFDQNIKLGNQNITLGDQNIASGVAKALRQPVLDQQHDTEYANGLIKIQQEIDSGKINLEHLPKKLQAELATAQAHQNSANASAFASRSSAAVNQSILDDKNLQKRVNNLVATNYDKLYSVKTLPDGTKEYSPSEGALINFARENSLPPEMVAIGLTAADTLTGMNAKKAAEATKKVTDAAIEAEKRKNNTITAESNAASLDTIQSDWVSFQGDEGARSAAKSLAAGAAGLGISQSDIGKLIAKNKTVDVIGNVNFDIDTFYSDIQSAAKINQTDPAAVGTFMNEYMNKTKADENKFRASVNGSGGSTASWGHDTNKKPRPSLNFVNK